MTNQNNEEVLELAKPYQWTGFNHHHVEGWTINTKDELLAFASALRENDAKLIAGMVEESKRLRKAISDMCLLSDNGELLLVAHNALINTDALSAAKSTAEAFMAEHDARVRKDAMEECKRICDAQSQVTKISGASNDYIVGRAMGAKVCATDIQAAIDAAEKRKSAKPEGEGK